MRNALVICLMLFLFSCQEEIRTREHGTRITSKDYPGKEKRIAVFRKLINAPSAIKDVEFDLFSVNGFDEGRTIPGASSSSYRYVVKVDPADVKLWTEYLPPVSKHEPGPWLDSLVAPRKEQRVRTSAPMYFGPVQGTLNFSVAYGAEGVVFREIVNN